jgi:hypothetical protein
MTAPRRRWFAFSLRTMFVGIALLSLPVGYVCRQWHIVQRRARIIEWLEVQPDVDISWAPDMTTHDPHAAFNAVTDWQALKVCDGDKNDYPNFFRVLWLGDRHIGVLALGPSPRPSYCSRACITEIFPETTVFSLRDEDHAR